jgi:hypothetical protein
MASGRRFASLPELSRSGWCALAKMLNKSFNPLRVAKRGARSGSGRDGIADVSGSAQHCQQAEQMEFFEMRDLESSPIDGKFCVMTENFPSIGFHI